MIAQQDACRRPRITRRQLVVQDVDLDFHHETVSQRRGPAGLLLEEPVEWCGEANDATLRAGCLDSAGRVLGLHDTVARAAVRRERFQIERVSLHARKGIAREVAILRVQPEFM